MSVRQIILLGVGLCCLMGSRSAYGQTVPDGAYTLVLPSSVACGSCLRRQEQEGCPKDGGTPEFHKQAPRTLCRQVSRGALTFHLS